MILFYMLSLCVLQNPSSIEQLEKHFEIVDFQSFKTEDGSPLIPSYIVYDHDRLFAIDSFDKTIVEFDNTGKVINQVGGKGQGPGEFGRPSMAKTDSKGHVYILDQFRHLFHVFKDDTLINTIKINHLPVPSSFHVVEADGKTLLYLVGSGQYKGEPYQGFLIDTQGLVIEKIQKITGPTYYSFVQGAVINQHELVMAHALGNRFSIFDTSGMKVDEFEVRHPKLTIIHHRLEETNEEEVPAKRSPMHKEPHTTLRHFYP
ncbi:6-bladed beta-propeller [Acanthopleuribacter pedis]|uniref:6-bladed beta-propeller n=1 Tax=Acanthopleuribacter pedis TaxID=442870 RepID=A0A8J7QCJ0_9BACT|nr:6-bladed beta-propeller [Acanthopleuribacter pedis]MBO1317045.1 6-bladed beta-propeller [Acanthopleuribacter pedis]